MNSEVAATKSKSLYTGQLLITDVSRVKNMSHMLSKSLYTGQLLITMLIVLLVALTSAFGLNPFIQVSY